MLKTTSPPIATISPLASPVREWAVVIAALVLGLFAFAIIFHEEIAAAFAVWNDSDAFSHCYLVLPVAAYLAWDRREAAMTTSLRPNPALALFAIPVAAAWFAADRLGIMEARQLLAMSLLQILVAALFGLPMWRALSAPLLYLYFLVPFGEFLVPPLQGLAVRFATVGLNLLGIPNIADGVTIQIPEGAFLVHQACSGLRFLIALLAFSVLYACLMYASSLRRLVFISVAFAVAVIGNDLRVLGIILIAHFIGNAQAIETDHVLWGWLFYVIIGSVLVVIGLRFWQERRQPVRVNLANSPRGAGASIVTLAVVLLLAAVPRAAGNLMDGFERSSAADVVQLAAPALAGCTTAPAPSVPPVATAEDRSVVEISQAIAYRCAGDLFVLTLRRYPPRISARALFSSLRGAQTPPDADVVQQTDIRAGNAPDVPVWRITESQKDGRDAAIATALWVNGRPTGGGIAARLGLALNTVRNSPVPPVVAIVSHSGQEWAGSTGHALAHFLGKSAPLSQLVGKFALAPATR